MEPKEISKKVVYVYMKLNNTCSRNNHSIENVSMNITNILDKSKMTVYVFNCRTCGKYFINCDQLKTLLNKKQIPAFKYSIVHEHNVVLNDVSILMLYGYTVKEGHLSEIQRQGILAWLIDQRIMDK